MKVHECASNSSVVVAVAFCVARDEPTVWRTFHDQ